MGILLYRLKLKLWLATLIFLPLVLFIVWIGPRLPQPIISFLSDIPVKQWDIFLLIYCFIASVIPMWLLLQFSGIAIKSDTVISGICGIILFILSVLLIFEAIRVLVLKPVKDKKA